MRRVGYYAAPQHDFIIRLRLQLSRRIFEGFMDTPRVVIKKYENRRLYDTTGSRYVNLDEVAQMVRSGTDVQVVDASSGEDLTRLILTQIIMEEAKGKESAFPLDMLRQMVMSSGASSQEALLKYMKSAMEMYQEAYRTFSPAATPLDFMRAMTGSGWTAPAQQAKAAREPEAEVDELRRRVEELEKMFADARKKGSGERGKKTR
jgi:polyhydroxyalkanoate synthesis repressor PhaR